jgi:hypothetical protein
MTSAPLITERPSPRRANETASRRSLHEFVQASGLRSLVVGVSKDPNAKITLLLLSPENGRPALAVKMPTTHVAERAVEAEQRLLCDLWSSQPQQVLEAIPRIFDVVEFEGRAAAVMTAVQGIPMTTTYLGWRHTAGSARVTADFAAVEAWLARF